MPMRHLCRSAAAALALAVVAPSTHAAPIGAVPIVIGHAGASGYLPGHTLAAYELAIKMGADYIEPDLQMTQDGVLVAMHDDTLTRTTNVATLYAPRGGSFRVSDFTLAEIKTLTVKPTDGASNSYPGFTPSSPDAFRVPTFQEVIDLAKQQGAATGRSIGLYPETKQNSPVMDQKVIATLQSNGYGSAGDKVFIQSFHTDSIMRLNAEQQALGLDMNLIVLGVAVTAPGPAYLMGVVPGNVLPLSAIAQFADGIGVNIDYTDPLPPGFSDEVTAEFIAAAHAAGLLVHAWTFGDPNAATAIAQYLDYYGRGIDGLFSNHPDLALAARSQFVPEPGMLALFAIGLTGLALRRRQAPAAD